MTVFDAIELMRRESSRLARPIALEGLPPMEFDSSFANESASAHEISESVPDCPQDMREFWMIARTAKLFTDNTYGQWGLEIFDPQQSLLITEQNQHCRKRDFRFGDLVIGRFLGDSDLLLLRTDLHAKDFGNVLVALPIDRRADWYCVAKSFGEFLGMYSQSGGEKYWAVS